MTSQRWHTHLEWVMAESLSCLISISLWPKFLGLVTVFQVVDPSLSFIPILISYSISTMQACWWEVPLLKEQPHDSLYYPNGANASNANDAFFEQLSTLCPQAMVYCYLDFKLSCLKNMKLLSIRVKIIWAYCLAKKNDGFYIILKAFSWKTDL